MTRSDQESPVPEIGTPGLKRRGLETGREAPRQSPTLLKTAKALGLTIPPSLLARADHVTRRVATDLERRRSLLTAAPGFALLDTRGKPAPPEVQTMRKWLDNQHSVGLVRTRMNRQRYRHAFTERI